MTYYESVSFKEDMSTEEAVNILSPVIYNGEPFQSNKHYEALCVLIAIARKSNPRNGMAIEEIIKLKADAETEISKLLKQFCDTVKVPINGVKINIVDNYSSKGIYFYTEIVIKL